MLRKFICNRLYPCSWTQCLFGVLQLTIHANQTSSCLCVSHQIYIESTVEEASTRHIASESLSTVQSTVEQISKLGIGEEHPGVSNSPSMQSGENLAVSEAAGVGLRPTLIDVLYSTPSIGTPVDCGASEGVVRKKAANKEQYLHRRTCKVICHLKLMVVPFLNMYASVLPIHVYILSPFTVA